MLTLIKKPNRHFYTYYHNNSLLIQFVLIEFIATYPIACQIKNLIPKLRSDSAQSLELSILTLIQCLNQLLGLASDNDRFLVSRWTKGPLTKLNHYCQQFSKNTHHQNKNGLNLYTYVNKAWISALHNWELLNIIQYSSTNEAITTLPLIKRSLNQLNNSLRAVLKQIPRVVNSFWDDENVIFFILRKQDQLAEIYGIDFIHKAFKLSAKKDTDIFQTLTQRYTKRGFGHLLPLIQ